MAQFPMSDSRRSTLERVPDYAVNITPATQTVTVKHGNLIIADSSAALLIAETKHQNVFYLPRADVRMDLLISTDHSTYCPFKGHASYFSLDGDHDLENFVWSYESPYPEVIGLKGYVSFYTSKVTQTAS